MNTSVDESPPPNIPASWIVSTTPTTRNRRPPIRTHVSSPVGSLGRPISVIAWSFTRQTICRCCSSMLENGRPMITDRPSMSCHSGQMPTTDTLSIFFSPYWIE